MKPTGYCSVKGNIHMSSYCTINNNESQKIKIDTITTMH